MATAFSFAALSQLFSRSSKVGTAAYATAITSTTIGGLKDEERTAHGGATALVEILPPPPSKALAARAPRPSLDLLDGGRPGSPAASHSPTVRAAIGPAPNLLDAASGQPLPPPLSAEPSAAGPVTHAISGLTAGGHIGGFPSHHAFDAFMTIARTSCESPAGGSPRKLSGSGGSGSSPSGRRFSLDSGSRNVNRVVPIIPEDRHSAPQAPSTARHSSSLGVSPSQAALFAYNRVVSVIPEEPTVSPLQLPQASMELDPSQTDLFSYNRVVTMSDSGGPPSRPGVAPPPTFAGRQQSELGVSDSQAHLFSFNRIMTMDSTIGQPKSILVKKSSVVLDAPASGPALVKLEEPGGADPGGWSVKMMRPDRKPTVTFAGRSRGSSKEGSW